MLGWYDEDHTPTRLKIRGVVEFSAGPITIDSDFIHLFPIALIPYREIQQSQCPDPYTDEDLAGEIRQYFLPDDFSNWKDHASFERAFSALFRDLRAQAQP